MIEMPDLFERHMTLGEQALLEKEYERAREHFDEAYQIKDDFFANVGLVKSLVELKLFEEAYELIKEKKLRYQKEMPYQEIYFHCLLQLNYFLEIEKFLLQFDSAAKEDWQKAYNIAKDYHLLIYKEKFKKIETEIKELDQAKPIAQGMILKKLIYLPQDKAVELIETLLVNPNVSLFSRSELVQQLVELQLEQSVELLTYSNELKQVVPKEVSPLKQVYSKSVILSQVSDYFAQNNPSLQQEVEKQVKLHIGCLYPFHEEVMVPTKAWVESYLMQYQGSQSQSDLEEVLAIQKCLDEAVLKLFSFH